MKNVIVAVSFILIAISGFAVDNQLDNKDNDNQLMMNIASNIQKQQESQNKDEGVSLLRSAADVCCSFLSCKIWKKSNGAVLSGKNLAKTIGVSLGVAHRGTVQVSCFDYYATVNPLKGLQELLAGSNYNLHRSEEVCPNFKYAIHLETAQGGEKNYLAYSEIDGKPMFHFVTKCPELNKDFVDAICTVRFYPESSDKNYLDTAVERAARWERISTLNFK